MFGGFKARMNLLGGRNKKSLQSELSADMTVSGAYRISRDDSFGYLNSFDQSKKTTAEPAALMRPTKSVNDLSKAKNLPPNLRHSTANVSSDPRGAEQLEPRNGNQMQKLTKNEEKEQKKLEKQRLAEQKAREKKAAQERAKQDKLAKEKEKKEALQAKRGKKTEKRPAPKPQATNTVAQAQTLATQYPTNTLESSISKSSGPPYYSNVTPPPENNIQIQSSNSNVIYSKPEDTDSWDMITQHRQEIIRPTTTIGAGKQSKQKVMDLNYNIGTSQDNRDNSDA